MESIGFPTNTVMLFLASITALFYADIAIHKRGEPVPFKAAVLWSLIYVMSAFLFSGYLLFAHGEEAAGLFLTGYTLEKVLAFDNLFVFSLIFTYFKIPPKDRYAALHWGIVGAIVFRLIFVALGVGSMALFGPFMELLFAGLIFYTIYLIIKSNGDETDYNSAWYVKRIRKYCPNVTPFIMAIFVIEISDIMFAFDSVPAIIAVTRDPLLIYSAMIFAILGLRSMYFVIDALKEYLDYMDEAIMFVLAFIGIKLVLHAVLNIHISAGTSLNVVLGILSIGIISSLINRGRL